jgi:putative AlgH/UPF0301 family transcriptional regulator
VDPALENPALSAVRVYAGHAGWGPGQLDGELEQDAWIVETAHAEDPFEEGDSGPTSSTARAAATRCSRGCPRIPR